jgi:uncharacterized protein involved in exopolysaccharide biosynthesis
MINTMGLYPRERGREPIEDIIDEMHKQIQILPVASMGGDGRTVPGFAVQFSYENRLLAQKVAQDLMSKFIDENFRARSASTYEGVQFFQDQSDAAQKKLDEVESKLVEFRIKNAGRLPDEMQGNIQQQQSLTLASSNLSTQISREDTVRLQMESELRFDRDRLAQLAKEPVDNSYAVQQKSQRLAEIDREIEVLETNLASMRNKYRDNYPDVQTAMSNLAILKQKREAINQEETESKKDAVPQPKPVNREVLQESKNLEQRINQLTSAIQAEAQTIDNLNAQLKKNAEAMRSVEARIDAAPLGDKEYDDLRRDRDLAKTAYEGMQANLAKAQVGKEMEDRKQGELLEILDPASLPEHVTNPNRPIVISVGAGIGLLLGIVIAGGREMKDTSLKNLKDVRAYTQMAILGSIPLLENDFVVRRRRRLAWLGWTTSSLAAIVVMAGSVVYYLTTRQ